MNVFKILDKLNIYIILQIISFFSFVPHNLKQITEERMRRLNNNQLIFKTRNDIIDENVVQNSLFYIYDRSMIYSDLELIGFRREFNIIKMFYKIPNKKYLRKFFYLIFRKNNIKIESSYLKFKKVSELYQMYLKM